MEGTEAEEEVQQDALHKAHRKKEKIPRHAQEEEPLHDQSKQKKPTDTK